MTHHTVDQGHESMGDRPWLGLPSALWTFSTSLATSSAGRVDQVNAGPLVQPPFHQQFRYPFALVLGVVDVMGEVQIQLHRAPRSWHQLRRPALGDIVETMTAPLISPPP